MRSLVSLAIILVFCGFRNAEAAAPKLVVNIVVSQMRYDYLGRMSENMMKNGFNRFLSDGIVFTDSRYNFMNTITPATLATLTTGAEPSTHGIVAERWIDYTTNSVVMLLDDNNAVGLGCDAGLGSYSPRNIIAPTLGDRLTEQSPDSKVVTIAADPVSAVVMGGHGYNVYWMDQSRGCWSSSTAYMDQLPDWVTAYNDKRVANDFLGYRWVPYLTGDKYRNKIYSDIALAWSGDFRKVESLLKNARSAEPTYDYPGLLYLPVGNTLVAEFAKQAILNESLGSDDHTDMLNICFDTPRYIGQVYGSESVEVEDMYYRLDAEIASLMSVIASRVDMGDVVVVLTSDHGSSDSYDYGRKERERFNASQFKVIMNGFMNAQYGPGDWVVEYCDRQLYLNRNLIYLQGLSLEEVQNRAAAFALQFRGVSHVLTSTAMQTSYFSGSYAEMMQNSFYPRRSGDLTVNLMPGWIEVSEGIRAGSGSMYEYDTHVPLMILGPKFYGQRVSRMVNMRDVAPTLAYMMGISRPIASEGDIIEEITKLY